MGLASEVNRGYESDEKSSYEQVSYLAIFQSYSYFCVTKIRDSLALQNVLEMVILGLYYSTSTWNFGEIARFFDATTESIQTEGGHFEHFL